jgi:hypothetical protein
MASPMDTPGPAAGSWRARISRTGSSVRPARFGVDDDVCIALPRGLRPGLLPRTTMRCGTDFCVADAAAAAVSRARRMAPVSDVSLPLLPSSDDDDPDCRRLSAFALAARAKRSADAPTLSLEWAATTTLMAIGDAAAPSSCSSSARDPGSSIESEGTTTPCTTGDRPSWPGRGTVASDQAATFDDEPAPKDPAEP